MDPKTYRTKNRTGWYLALILAALLMHLAVDAPLRREAGERLAAFFRSDRLFRVMLYLETGGTVRLRAAAVPAESRETDCPPETNAVLPSSSRAEERLPETDLPVRRTESVSAADAVMPEPEDTVPETEAAAAEIPQPSEAPFTADEAEAVVLRGNCGYTVDKAELLLRPLGWSDVPGPKLLIIHSHTSEAYTPSPGHSYVADGDYRTLEPSASVVAVGDTLTEELGKLGVEVIHDRTCCDYPSYNQSYAVARTKIRKWLEDYPSIQMVIDVHRDAMDPPVREVSDATGEETAALMLVIGTDEGGLSHPHWQDNLSCGLKLQVLAERTFPGLFKPISFRKERFNGDLTPGSLIVEVGSTGNTLEEAQASMPALAALLSRLLAIAVQDPARSDPA